jgi:hypothetical protein
VWAPRLFERSPFEGRRTDLPDRRMATPLVIEHLDVVEQLHPGLPAAVEPIGELAFRRREEGFNHRRNSPREWEDLEA